MLNPTLAFNLTLTQKWRVVFVYNTVTLCLNMSSPHRCLRSSSERLQTRAGLFSEGTQTSPDSTIRCIFSLCTHMCRQCDPPSPPPPACLKASFVIYLNLRMLGIVFECTVLIRAPQRCSVFLNNQQDGDGVENRGAARKL